MTSLKKCRMNLYLAENLVESLKKLAENDGRSLNAYAERALQRHIQTEASKTQEARTSEIPFKMG